VSRLAGRVALVTGALRGIGLAIAERYAAEGATVVLTDLSPPDDALVRETLARLGKPASYLTLDVADEAAWQAAEREVRVGHGRLDVLVNNAGVDCVSPVEKLEMAAWRRIMSINCDGVFLGTKTFAPLLAETGRTTRCGSSIVNMSSVMGFVGFVDASAYNAGKGAVRLFTKATAVEFAAKKTPIRVNSIHPGFVITPLLRAGFERAVEKGYAKSADEMIAAVEGMTPLGRLADPAEIAGAAFFLASDDSSYCTGSELVVDGGYTAR
jgi:NAD(P)-dependent dehydrogenase (short-subunit alcohol dehydrogenase family)